MLTARNAMLSVAMWLGVLQSVLPVHDNVSAGTSLVSIAQLVGFASVLGSLTVLVYRLGVWRQEMENTKHNVGAEVKAHRDESTANFDRLERRLEAIDHVITAAAEQRVRATRWQSRTERRLARLEVATDGTQ
jgi:hypothetical protein